MINDKSSGSHEASTPSPRAWQDAPELSAEERQVLAALKAAVEAMLAIPREAQVPFANPDKFSGPIGFLDNGLPSGGVAAHAPLPHRSWPFTVAEMVLLLRAIDAAPIVQRNAASPALTARDLSQAQQDLASRGVLTERGLDPQVACVGQCQRPGTIGGSRTGCRCFHF